MVKIPAPLQFWQKIQPFSVAFSNVFVCLTIMFGRWGGKLPGMRIEARKRNWISGVEPSQIEVDEPHCKRVSVFVDAEDLEGVRYDYVPEDLFSVEDDFGVDNFKFCTTTVGEYYYSTWKMGRRGWYKDQGYEQEFGYQIWS